jgi:hypothetical protein
MASSPQGCPGPSTAPTNERTTRRRSTSPATFTLSRTVTPVISSPPSRRPGRPAGGRTDAQGNARSPQPPSSSPLRAAGWLPPELSPASLPACCRRKPGHPGRGRNPERELCRRLLRFLIFLHWCFLDDNCSGPGVKSSGSATIPDAVSVRALRARHNAISPFPRQLKPFRLEIAEFPRQFPRYSSLSAPELITVRPRAFPAAPAAFPRPPSPPASLHAHVTSPSRTPSRVESRGPAGTDQEGREPELNGYKATNRRQELTHVTHVRPAIHDCFTGLTCI